MKIFRAEPSRRHRFDDAHLGRLDRLFISGTKAGPDFNRRMFEEDFAGIFRYGKRDDGKLFRVSSSNEDLTDRLLSGFQSRYGRSSVDKTVREWVEEIAQELIWFRVSYYWVGDDVASNEIHIGSFSSRGVLNLFGTHIQWVPRQGELQWDRDDAEVTREIRILNSAKVMYFVMPKQIKRMISRQNATLAVIDKHHYGVTDLQPQVTHENPNPANHFDFNFWKDTQERALYRSTRASGWSCRKYDSSKRSEFFDCHRLIRFRRNQLVLRDNILKQLSAELSRIGQGYQAEYTLNISGTDNLPKVGHLDDLEARLTREEVGFTEILDYCLKC